MDVVVRRRIKCSVVRASIDGKYALCYKKGDRCTVVFANSKGKGGIVSQEFDKKYLEKEYTLTSINPYHMARQLANSTIAQVAGVKNQKIKTLLEDTVMSYLINEDTLKVEGRIPTAMDQSGIVGIIINEIKDLQKLSVAQLTMIHNEICPEDEKVKKFPDTKTGSKKVMELLDGLEDLPEVGGVEIPGQDEEDEKGKGKGKGKGGKKEGKAADKPKEKGENAPANNLKPKDPKYKDDQVVIPLAKSFNEGSLREQFAKILPKEGITVKDLIAKAAKKPLEWDVKQVRSVLDKMVIVKGAVVVNEDEVKAALKQQAEAQKEFDKKEEAADKKKAATEQEAAKGKAAQKAAPAKKK